LRCMTNGNIAKKKKNYEKTFHFKSKKLSKS